ncbi:MAG: HlyD family efflux transporter periplasmic adaptor subunit [Aquisalinus sp.]|nr:HlyD family efflux transporter periplasmic adaptor subunit [Aquisalinus sp.]
MYDIIAMTRQLFREEAIEHQRRRLTGEVFLVQPVKFMIIALCLFCLTILAVVFLIQNTYARKETVSGHLTPDVGLVRVATKEFGVVESVFVEQGASVSTGDKLFSISIEASLQSGEMPTEEMMRVLLEEEEEVSARLRLIEESFDAKKQELGMRILGLERERVDLESQITLQNSRVNIAESQYLTYEQLYNEDAASRLEAESANERWIQSQQELSNLHRQLKDRKSQKELLELQVISLPTEREIAVSEIKERLAGFKQRKTNLMQQAGYVVTAPVSGTVANLRAKVGSSVTPGGFQVAILPEGGQLVAHLFAPTRAAGFVEPGQPVRIMYEAFPFQRFGSANGLVSEVSATVLLPEDGPGSVGIQEPVYKVVVKLEKQYVDAYGEQFSLQDGMALQADIILDRRTLIEWLFEPLIALGRR